MFLHADVSERFKETVLKTVDVLWHRRFESCHQRHFICRRGETGIRPGFRFPCLWRKGSSPFAGTCTIGVAATLLPSKQTWRVQIPYRALILIKEMIPLGLGNEVFMNKYMNDLAARAKDESLDLDERARLRSEYSGVCHFCLAVGLIQYPTYLKWLDELYY